MSVAAPVMLGAACPICPDASAARLSGWGSRVVITVHRTAAISPTAPISNVSVTDGGKWPAGAVPGMANQCVRIHGKAEEKTAPAPMKKTWTANPSVCWSLGKLSAISARNGSAATFTEAVRHQSARLAAQRSEEHTSELQSL